jgi:hypothetical protein
MRAATAARLVFGSACLVVPRRVLAAAGSPDRADLRVQRITRALGVRLVTQAALDRARGGRTEGLGIAVELTHAVTMLPAAVLWPAHRRSACVSAAIATGLAVLDLTERRP